MAIMMKSEHVHGPGSKDWRQTYRTLRDTRDRNAGMHPPQKTRTHAHSQQHPASKPRAANNPDVCSSRGTLAAVCSHSAVILQMWIRRLHRARYKEAPQHRY